MEYSPISTAFFVLSFLCNGESSFVLVFSSIIQFCIDVFSLCMDSGPNRQRTPGADVLAKTWGRYISWKCAPLWWVRNSADLNSGILLSLFTTESKSDNFQYRFFAHYRTNPCCDVTKYTSPVTKVPIILDCAPFSTSTTSAVFFKLELHFQTSTDDATFKSISEWTNVLTPSPFLFSILNVKHFSSFVFDSQGSPLR